MRMLIIVFTTLLLVACKQGGQELSPDGDFLTQPESKDILVIGDSISQDYYNDLAVNLSAFDITHIGVDGGSTVNALANIDTWLAVKPHYKLIIFNFGQDDLLPSNGISVNDYGNNLTIIINKLLAVSDHIIFVTTTPVPRHEANGRIWLDDNYYNQKAVDILFDDYGLGYCDLNSIALNSYAANHIDPIGETDIHYDSTANQAFADYITNCVVNELQ